MIFIVHSSGGLLLCSRGEQQQVHYYVCNPVTWQLVALPELPWPGHYNGLLSVAANEDGTIKNFQVVLVNYPWDWKRQGDTMYLDLKVFSSDTGQWRAMKQKLRHPSLDVGRVSSAFVVLPLPNRDAKDARNQCLGELQGGGLRYAHFDFSVFEMWDLQKGGENGMGWKLVHRISVMELAQQNPVATDFACNSTGAVVEDLINTNSLFTVIGFHPTEDIVF
ncbi:hypothetical protein BAE44_0022192 [Dichanthelium oligosanthes]|uniref:F-box protein At3g26010-like beta-propeller domain-containing protein n=1 Tax=Dichanthelium oligosanthes TaxID=888268 RepID=A0A1E5UV37_9POAL|nr:hypothetical protein BAE44_0022192 [Dichanthelium oligosanthes]